MKTSTMLLLGAAAGGGWWFLGPKYGLRKIDVSTPGARVTLYPSRQYEVTYMSPALPSPGSGATPIAGGFVMSYSPSKEETITIGTMVGVAKISRVRDVGMAVNLR